jgi:hypothetical protein
MMQWHELVDQHTVPRRNQILDFMGESAPQWESLDEYLQKTLHSHPHLIYSHSSAQPGWYIQYEKNERELCAVFPMREYFIVRVILQRGEEERVQRAIAHGRLSVEIADLYNNSSSSAAGRWLIMEVEAPEILRDIELLTELVARSTHETQTASSSYKEPAKSSGAASRDTQD